MNNIKPLIYAIVLLGLSPMSHANVESIQNSSILDNQIVLANNSGVRINLDKEFSKNKVNSVKVDNEHLPITTSGLIFALSLFAAGALVGRKTKAKNKNEKNFVGAFTRAS